jgi:hypothetical protein
MVVVNGSVPLMHHMLGEFLFRFCLCVSMGYVVCRLYQVSIKAPVVLACIGSGSIQVK